MRRDQKHGISKSATKDSKMAAVGDHGSFGKDDVAKNVPFVVYKTLSKTAKMYVECKARQEGIELFDNVVRSLFPELCSEVETVRHEMAQRFLAFPHKILVSSRPSCRKPDKTECLLFHKIAVFYVARRSQAKLHRDGNDENEHTIG